MKARITVTLRNGVLDPQGKAIASALASLNFEGIEGVRQGKIFDVVLQEQDEGKARKSLQEMCEKLLANTVIENYQIDIVGSR